MGKVTIEIKKTGIISAQRRRVVTITAAEVRFAP